MSDNPSPSTSVAVAPRLGEAVVRAVGSGDDPRALIDLMHAAAAREIGGMPAADAPESEIVVYRANLGHEVTLALAGLQQRSNIAFRLHVWDMYMSNEYLMIRIPITDEYGAPTLDRMGRPQVIKFADFDDWFAYVAEKKHLDATIASVTRNCVRKLLPMVNADRIKVLEIDVNEDGSTDPVEHMITVSDVMNIGRSNLEVVMGPVSKLIDLYGKTSDESLLTQIGYIVRKAQTATKEDLKAFLSRSGLRGTTIRQLDTLLTSVGDGNVAYTIVTRNDSERRYLDGILSGRLNSRSIDISELPVLLSDLARGEDIIQGEVIEEPDMEEYLRNA